MFLFDFVVFGDYEDGVDDEASLLDSQLDLLDLLVLPCQPGLLVQLCLIDDDDEHLALVELYLG